MFCKKCGRELKEGTKFCTSCGCKVEYVNVDVKNNVVDEFELEKQRLAQEELKKKIEAENEKKEELQKEKQKKQKEFAKKVGRRLLTSCIFICIVASIAFSIYSLYDYFNNNGIVNDGENIMLKIDGLYQKNVRIKYNDKIYYLGNDGKPQLYKLSTIGDKLKAQDQSGNYMKNQTLKIDGDYYHFDELGDAIKSQLFDDYFFNSDGKMIINNWNGDYYFGEDGKMQKETWIDNYYVGADGKYLKSSWTPDGLYVDSKGEKVLNNKVIDNGKMYFVGDDGKKVINSWCSLGSEKYHTDNNGVLYAGAKYKENENNYYFKSDGAMLRNASADGHYADSNGILAINKAVGFNYFDANGDVVVDTWIGDIYYDKQGTQVLNGWAQDYYLMNGIKQVNKWVDTYYYVGEDGKYLKDTYVNGYQLGVDGKWTGVVDYGLEITFGNSMNYTYTGNRTKIRRKYFSDDDDTSYWNSYLDDLFDFASTDYEDMEQDVNVVKLTSIISNTGALDKNQLNNIKTAVNDCLYSIFESYKSEIKKNINIRLIDCNDIILSTQQYNKIIFYCNAEKELFNSSTIDISFYITYNMLTNKATQS